MGLLLFPIYLAAAVICGRYLLRRSGTRASRKTSAAEMLMAGHLLFGGMYGALKLMALSGGFAPLVILLTVWAVRDLRGISLRNLVETRKLIYWTILIAIAIAVTHASDPISLLSPHPVGFYSIDTPLWLTLAYGIEQAIPAPDILFRGATVNYNYGAEIFVAKVRHLTGLPMHLSYLYLLILNGLLIAGLLPALIARHLPLRRRGRRALWLVAPLLGLAWQQTSVHNFGSVTGTCLFLFLILQVRRGCTWKQLPVILLASQFLQATKEIYFVFGVVIALGLCALIFWRTRDKQPFFLFGLSAALAKIGGDVVLRPQQKVSFEVFREHLHLSWAYGMFRPLLPCLVMALGMLVVSMVRKDRRSTYFVLAGLVPLGVGVAVYALLRPVFHPEMDSFSLSWIYNDMGQFVTLGEHLLWMVLASCLLWWAIRARVPIALLVVAALGSLELVRNKTPAVPYGFEGNDGVDPVIELLQRVDVRRGLIAANHLKWNHESPEWAAFFGHRFYHLREGRWVTAQESYSRVTANQRSIFGTASFDQVVKIAREDGITHVITDKKNPAPWSKNRRPTFENASYALYEIVPLPVN